MENNGMRTTIDMAGRVVIPAAVRDRMGLPPGTDAHIAVIRGSRSQGGVMVRKAAVAALLTTFVLAALVVVRAQAPAAQWDREPRRRPGISIA